MLDALTLDQMRTFVAVAEAGSFRAGAARLLRVQSAVSHAVANLEAQLGVTLFDRSGHRPELTAEGRSLLVDVRAILLKVDALRARAQGLAEGIELGLAIAVDTLFPPAVAAAALKELHEVYPSVSVRVIYASLGGTIAALRERHCVLAVTAFERSDPQIAMEALMPLSMTAVVSPAHPLAATASKRKRISTVELADHLQIVVEDPSSLTEGQDFGVLSPSTWRVSDMQTKHALILAGVGWGSLPSWMAEEDLAGGRLVRVAAAELGAMGETPSRAYLAHRTDHALGLAAQRLSLALRKQAAEYRKRRK
ncbi:MAG TPA: LysR family transcriptional regulator [Noviherbaspirillum sp.]|nr:LysR family transcriptional regulator [Noviherbaspirillum sp.]